VSSGIFESCLKRYLLNGVPRDITFGDLRAIVDAIQRRGANVIIGGLKFPGNDRGFGEAYKELAGQTGSVLIANIFAGIIGNPRLMSDPIHPNNAGYTLIAHRFYEAMRP
jgi:acyl-CoA thioesterase-1